MTDLQLIVWGIATLILAMTTLFAVATSFYLYDWRRQLLNDPIKLVPKEVAQELKDLKDLLSVSLSEQNEEDVPNTELLEQKMDDLQQSFLTLRRALDRRDEENSRLKAGYDRYIFKRFLKKFLKVEQALDDELTAPDRRWESMQGILDLLRDALEECGVRRFAPEIGEEYRSAFGVADDPKFVGSENEETWGQIAEVLQPGYALQDSDGGPQEILREARVSVYTGQN